MSIFPAILGAACLASETVLGRALTAKRAGAQSHDAGSLRLLWRTIALACTVGVTAGSMGLGPALWPAWRWGFIGCGVFALGTAIRWWAILHLGRFFTVDVAVASDQRLVDDGPYRWARHPSYTGLMLMFLGLGLSFGRLLPVILILAPVFWVFRLRMELEERALLAALGEPYRAYQARTSRLVPGLY